MRLFDKAFQKLIKQGELIVISATGREYRYGKPYPGREPVRVRFTDKSTPRKIVLSPSLGAGEAYMDGRLLMEQGDIYALLDLVTWNNRFENRPDQKNLESRTRLPGDPFGFYEPKAIGEDFKRAWATLHAFGITTRGNTCTACHRMGNMNSCNVAMQQSTGTGHQEGGDDWSRKYPQSHWMSPGNLHSRAQWDEQFSESLKKLAACCKDPKGAGCRVVEYGRKDARR